MYPRSFKSSSIDTRSLTLWAPRPPVEEAKGQQRGMVEQQADHEQPGADGQVDDRRRLRPPVNVPEQQVQRDSDEQKGHGHRHVDVAGDSWQRRAGVRSSGDVHAGVHSHLDDGGHDHDEQVDGTGGSG